MSGRKAILAAGLIIIAISGWFIAKGSQVPQPTEETKIEKYELNKKFNTNALTGCNIEGIDKKVNKYLEKWDMKGASLAIMRNDSLVYAKGYGWADEEKSVSMTPGHIMRMASVSKLITATGIMVLCDKGLLSLDSPVFGENGILSDEEYASVIKDRNYEKITVEHLLRHQAGFYRDPVFSNIDVKKQMKLDNPPTYEDYARLVLSHRLIWQPGQAQRYSNFSYMVLSAIIEKISGETYERFMQKEVLEPAGCYDMHIADNYYKGKRENEVRYYTHEGDGKIIEEYNGSGKMVERCYGGNNIQLLSGAGAWCGSTIELARFVASIDGRPEIPDIISKESYLAMTEYFTKEIFSLGWNDTNPSSGWSRTGTLAGTSALIKYFPDGECWIMITNTSTWRGPSQPRYTDYLFKDCRKLYSDELIEQDLFTNSPSKITCEDDVTKHPDAR